MNKRARLKTHIKIKRKDLSPTPADRAGVTAVSEMEQVSEPGAQPGTQRLASVGDAEGVRTCAPSSPAHKVKPPLSQHRGLLGSLSVRAPFSDECVPLTLCCMLGSNSELCPHYERGLEEILDSVLLFIFFI